MKLRNTLIFAIAALLIGCKAAPTENGNQAATAANAPVNQSANAANSPVNANKPANANSNKTADNSPKRISFTKGANWGAASITLAPGSAQKFVVSAKSGQTMEVESSSSDVSINLVKGKATTTEDFGFLNAELQSNGDYIFEVRNSTKKEVKASIKVTINGGDPKSDPTYEEPVPVDDDEGEEAPQPSGRPKN